MKKLVITLALFTMLILTSCGHNIGTVVHGKFINIGYDPELNKVGIQYVDGTMLTGLQKEKSKSGMKYIDTVEKDGVKTITELDYSTENGAQVTGYQVDMVEAMGDANVKKEDVIQTKKDVAEIAEEPK